MAQVCIKMGIFIRCMEEPEETEYNPMNPQDDVRGMYQWRVQNVNHYEPEGDWSVAGVQEGHYMFYFKQLKSSNSTNM